MAKESEIIGRIRSRAGHSGRVTVGIGDDAAAVRVRTGFEMLACCDLVVEGVHFRREWSEPRLIGHKSLAVTVSDVAAMGGVPLFALLSVALPHGLPERFADELMDGIFAFAESCGVTIIGGDTSLSPDSVFIDTMVLGECPEGRHVLRSGASPGDLVFVTGGLGASAAGLRLLEKGWRLDSSVADDGLTEARREALRRLLAPVPRVRAGAALGESGLATSMIDISDGLSTDLGHILEESRVGAVLDADSIPVAACVRLLEKSEGFDPLHLALQSGEEYELLFTARAENRDRVRELMESVGIQCPVIGRITEGAGLKLDFNGRLEPIGPSGFEHEI